jgi:hypothetical protein
MTLNLPGFLWDMALPAAAGILFLSVTVWNIRRRR